jgi:energy-coupling factor transporter ATP-binding protein EcfA2
MPEDGAKTKEQLLARPMSVEQTGLRFGVLSDLALKTVYTAGEITGQEMARALCLPFKGIVDGLLVFLDRQKLIQVTGSAGFGEQNFRYSISRKGTEQVRELLGRSQYVGPAPVLLEDYSQMMRMQGIGSIHVGQQSLRQAFDGLVINDAMFNRIGAALNSGRSIFLYGPSGNGKTSIARAMARVLGRDGIYVPYAIEVAGQVIKVYDEFNHRRIDAHPSSPSLRRDAVAASPEGWRDAVAASPGLGEPPFTPGAEKDESEVDARWVLIERPIIMVGGELTLESLDLTYNPTTNYYEAPYQMKANGGMFLIDDFGRQRMNPRDLLNRWIIPLETRVDFFSLHTGRKIEIPFEQLVVFATNLDPAQLVDAAFLRRIHHKIKVDDPSPEEFAAVFRIVCTRRGVLYDQDAFAYLMQEWYIKPQRALRYSHPRDLIGQIMDICKFEGTPPRLTREYISRACDAYFGEL